MASRRARSCLPSARACSDCVWSCSADWHASVRPSTIAGGATDGERAWRLPLSPQAATTRHQLEANPRSRALCRNRRVTPPLSRSPTAPDYQERCAPCRVEPSAWCFGGDGDGGHEPPAFRSPTRNTNPNVEAVVDPRTALFRPGAAHRLCRRDAPGSSTVRDKSLTPALSPCAHQTTGSIPTG